MKLQFARSLWLAPTRMRAAMQSGVQPPPTRKAGEAPPVHAVPDHAIPQAPAGPPPAGPPPGGPPPGIPPGGPPPAGPPPLGPPPAGAAPPHAALRGLRNAKRQDLDRAWRGVQAGTSTQAEYDEMLEEAKSAHLSTSAAARMNRPPLPSNN